MIHIFTYGSLMFPAVFERIARGRYQNTPAQVQHFHRSVIRNHSYPVVVPKRLSPPLDGTLYFDVHANDLRRLDLFEGGYYQRQSVEVQLADAGRTVGAEIYVLKPRYRHLASGKPWSADEFEHNHLQRFIETYCR